MELTVKACRFLCSLPLVRATLLVVLLVTSGRLSILSITPATARASSPDVLTVLVGALDSRERPQEMENTDVLMIARIDIERRTVRAINVPRDLYLDIPGYGAGKINRAWDLGASAGGTTTEKDFEAGAALLKETIRLNFGVEPDAVVLTNFGGFGRIVDALGGVEVVNPYDVYDAEYPTPDNQTKEIFYPAGPLHLDGEQALEFARTRHQDCDDGRVMRQQLVLRALLDQARNPKIAASLPRLVTKTRGAVQTDLTEDQQLTLVKAAPRFTNDGVTFATLNAFLSPGTAPTGEWIYEGDWSQIPSYVQAFLAGTGDAAPATPSC